ncbi:hypothetical protein BDQ12DRAFT_692471 [Crucibulum laeve]|uniref:Uncharacterized protein n=1 Tax=Crucibulum laeve TaxID=68775 RepID=A0A5C3LH74_9AGAR|nr:hypothetical protein BDQ12DRAFT_692471 [Crucibulum laeve]
MSLSSSILVSSLSSFPARAMPLPSQSLLVTTTCAYIFQSHSLCFDFSFLLPISMGKSLFIPIVDCPLLSLPIHRPRQRIGLEE